jgi:hypothetical protein
LLSGRLLRQVGNHLDRAAGWMHLTTGRKGIGT